MVFLGTSVYSVILSSCFSEYGYSVALIVFTNLIMNASSPTNKPIATRENNQDEKINTLFYIQAFMFLFVPIAAWAKNDVIFKHLARQRVIAGLILSLTIFVLVSILSLSQLNGLLLIQCFKTVNNNSWTGYRIYKNDNTTFFDFIDIGIKICQDQICPPAIRICADNEEPLDKQWKVFLPIGVTLFVMSYLVLAIEVLHRNKYRLYTLKKYLYFCSSGTINIDLFHYCARKMKSSKHRDEMLQIFNQAIEKDKSIINQKDNLYGETCAFCALDAEDYDLLERILDLGGNLYLNNNNGENVFGLLRKKFEAEDDVKIKSKMKTILANKKVKENYYPTTDIASTPTARKYEVWKEQPMQKYVREESFWKLTCLVWLGGSWYARDQHCKPIFECLLEKIESDENVLAHLNILIKWWILKMKDDLGQPLIHIAVLTNNHMCIQSLIDNGADVNVVNSKDEMTPLHYAAHIGCSECTEMLIKNRANIDAKDYFGQTPLFIAINQQKYQCIKLLIDNGADINAKDRHYQTPLNMLGFNFSLSDEERKEMLTFLINLSAEYNTFDKEGYSLLHGLALNVHPSCLKLLINEGADINVVNKSGETLLHMVAITTLGNSESKEMCFKYLIGAGADVNAIDKDGNSPIHKLACKSLPSCLKMLISNQANVNTENKKGETPLHLISQATAGSTENCVTLLTEAGANVNAKDKVGNTPLHTLAFNSQPICLKLLIDQGGDIKAANKKGETPLHMVGRTTYGSTEDREECIKYLLENGADVNARSGFRVGFKTPKSYKIIKNYLKNHPRACQAATGTNNDIATSSV